MSKLDELILKLCPNGVNYSKLGEYCNVFTGGEAPEDHIKSKAPEGDYVYPIFSNGLNENSLYGYAKNYKIEVDAITFSSIGTIGFPTIRKGKFTPIIRLKVIVPRDNSKLLLNYLKYALEIADFLRNASTVPNVNADMIKGIQIPIPPLEVQQEIVRILDNFIELTLELKVELKFRKQQYEYYLNKLFIELNSDAKCKAMEFKDIGSIERGGGLQKSDFTESGIPCIHYGQIYTYFGTYTSNTISVVSFKLAEKLKKVHYGNLIIAVTSENIEDVCKGVAWLGNKDIVTGGHTAIFRHNQNPKYIAYFLKTILFFDQKRKLAHGTKVIEVTPRKLEDIMVPLPPLREQARIVSILDRFDNLINDTKQGLPAEIATRQKQYEYYRDKLLTFKEVGNESI